MFTRITTPAECVSAAGVVSYSLNRAERTQRSVSGKQRNAVCRTIDSPIVTLITRI